MDLHPVRTAMKAKSTDDAIAGANRAKALYEGQEATLKAQQDQQREFEQERMKE
jgi:hypothetical protein